LVRRGKEDKLAEKRKQMRLKGARYSGRRESEQPVGGQIGRGEIIRRRRELHWTDEG